MINDRDVHMVFKLIVMAGRCITPELNGTSIENLTNRDPRCPTIVNCLAVLILETTSIVHFRFLDASFLIDLGKNFVDCGLWKEITFK